MKQHRLLKSSMNQIVLQMIQCNKCQTLKSQHEVECSQLTFEIKKLKEDMAEQKLTLDMRLRKQRTSLLQQISKEKNQRQIQNKIWMNKYDQVMKQWKNDLNTREKHHEQIVLEIRESVKQQQQANYQQRQNFFNHSIERLKIEHKKEIDQLIQRQKEQKKNLKQMYQQKLQKMQNQLKNTQQIFDRQRQTSKIQLELIQEEVDKKSLKEVQLQTQIHLLRNLSQDLNKEIMCLKQNIKELQNQSFLKDKQKNRICKNHQNYMKSRQIFYKTELQMHKAQMNKNIQEILQRELQTCKQTQEHLAKIQQKRQLQKKCYQQQIQTLNQQLQQKISPVEFNTQIAALHTQLSNKDKEFQKANHQIRQCLLQISNKQETLKRFFQSSKHVQQSRTPSINKKTYNIKKTRNSMNTSSKDFFKFNGFQSTKINEHPGIRTLGSLSKFL